MTHVRAGDEGPPEYARGGLVIGPNGEDGVEVRLFEREAIVDRDGRVICRHVGGRLIPPEDGEPAIYDADDATWSTGPFRVAQLIIGGFTVRIGEDGSEVVADDDAIVFDLDDGEDCGGACTCCDADCGSCCCCRNACPPESYCLACGRRI